MPGSKLLHPAPTLDIQLITMKLLKIDTCTEKPPPDKKELIAKSQALLDGHAIESPNDSTNRLNSNAEATRR